MALTYQCRRSAAGVEWHLLRFLTPFGPCTWIRNQQNEPRSPGSAISCGHNRSFLPISMGNRCFRCDRLINRTANNRFRHEKFPLYAFSHQWSALFRRRAFFVSALFSLARFLCQCAFIVANTWFSSVQISSLASWVVGGTWKTIHQRTSSNLFCRRPLRAVLAWADMSTIWGCPSSISFADYDVAHSQRCPERWF